MLLCAPRRSIVAVFATLTLAGISGCEPMQPSGSPLSPVPVVAAIPGSTPGAAGMPVEDARFDDAEPIVLGSESLKPSTGGDAGGTNVRVSSTVAPTPVTSVDGEAETDEVVATAPEATPPTTLEAVAAMVAQDSTWPVRLVRTHLDEQPPSAVLALPDGRRVVVSPGEMVPERGLVVMAIGKDRVHLAQVTSKGDHATVVPVELTAQY